MNVKEYIKSGVIESYVLGVATDAERQEFEQMCANYPEVVEARNTFELLLEGQLMKDAVEAPLFLKERIQQHITPNNYEETTTETIEEAPVRQMNVWKWVAAASLILLAGSLFWTYNTNKKYNALADSRAGIEKELQEKKDALAAIEQDAAMLQKPGVKMAALKGTATAPQAFTTVYWDSTNKDVYLLVNNLPQAPSGKQYQLWALLDGQPIDLGMLEVKEKRLLVKMKNVQRAQAFAITLEETGGSLTPKGQMYVLGNL